MKKKNKKMMLTDIFEFCILYSKYKIRTIVS